MYRGCNKKDSMRNDPKFSSSRAPPKLLHGRATVGMLR